MPHDTPLIATIVTGLGLAFVFGVIAQRLRLSPLVGYLLAGVIVGPFTPGFVADQHLATDVLAAANLAGARRLVVAIPNAFEAGQVVGQARTASKTIEIIARAHSDAEVDYLSELGANTVIMGEREIARGMIEHLEPTGQAHAPAKADPAADHPAGSETAGAIPSALGADGEEADDPPATSSADNGSARTDAPQADEPPLRP